MLHQGNRFSSKYSEETRRGVEDYFNSQLDKVDLPYVSTEERAFMLTRMLEMYANPLRNKLRTILCSDD